MSITLPNSNVYIIGITGRTGSGKSLARKMLEHLGCLTVDADRLAHQVYRSGSSAYREIVDEFGVHILDQQGDIDRQKLSKIVFTDPQALLRLEALTHPAVTSALHRIINLTPLPVIAVEAIKLIESRFSRSCDSIWLVDAPDELIFDRLEKSRGISPADILARMDSQSSIGEKKKHATFFIENKSGVQDMWRQVQAGWDTLSSKSASFQSSVQAAKESISPFSASYRMPQMETAAEMAYTFTSRVTQPALSTATKGIIDLYDPDDHKDLTNLCFHILCTHHVYEYQGKGNQLGFLMAAFQHFKGCITDTEIHPSAELPNPFKETIRRIEGFSRLHLIATLKIRSGRKNQGLDKLGYELESRGERQSQLDKAEYNVYGKNILPVFDFFDEQGQ